MTTPSMSIVESGRTGLFPFLLVTFLLLAVPAFAGDRTGGGGRHGRGDNAWSGETEPSPARAERWKQLSPEEKKELRERYKQFKKLPADQQERVKDRFKKWEKLPDGDKSYLKERRDLYKGATPEEREVVSGFLRRLRTMDPDRREEMKKNLREWKDLPSAKREKKLENWPYYRQLGPTDRETMKRFFFERPEESTGKHSSGGRSHDRHTGDEADGEHHRSKERR